MKVLNRDEMMTWLTSKGVNVIGTTEQFYGGSEGTGIWVSGEGSDLFDYDSKVSIKKFLCKFFYKNFKFIFDRFV